MNVPSRSETRCQVVQHIAPCRRTVATRVNVGSTIGLPDSLAVSPLIRGRITERCTSQSGVSSVNDTSSHRERPQVLFPAQDLGAGLLNPLKRSSEGLRHALGAGLRVR